MKPGPLHAHRRSLQKIELAFTRFNAARTLGSPEPSRFEAREFGAAVAMQDRARASRAFINRALETSEESLAHLGELLAWYEESSIPPALLIWDADLTPTLQAGLNQAGFRPGETLIYLHAQPVPQQAPAGPPVCRWTEDRADAFLNLLARSGAPLTEELRELRREYYCTDRFRTFIASAQDEAVAWGTTFVDGELGFLANAFTFEEARNQGCHQAILKARLQDAADLGLSWVVTDVEPDSGSERNCRRLGFETLGLRTTWTR